MQGKKSNVSQGGWWWRKRERERRREGGREAEGHTQNMRRFANKNQKRLYRRRKFTCPT